MKKRLILILLAGSLGMASAMAMPDAPVGTPPDEGQRYARMQTDLGLTTEQASQVQTIETAQREKMEALRVAGHEQIAALLTAEQAAKFEQMAGQRPQGRMPGNGQRPPERGNPPPDGMGRGGKDPVSGMMARMKTDLGLSDEQATQIEAIQQAQRTQMDALHTETQTLIKQVLTVEQLVRFEQMEQRRHPQPPVQ